MAILMTDQSNYEDIADAIREKNGTGETYLPSEMAGAIRSIHGDVTGVKGDSESSYRTGNVNLTPANIGAKATQTPVASPSASGTAVEFIDTISQNAQGVITPTKKTVRTATASQSGLMSAADKGNLDNAVADISGLKTRMTAAEDYMSILAVCPTLEQTDSFIVQDGAVDAPLTGLTIYGKSYQDTSISPTPSSPKSITTAGSSGTLKMVSAGKNLLPLTNPETRTSNGITFTRQANGAVTFNGQNNNSGESLYTSTSFTLPAGTYILSGALSNGGLSEGSISLLLEGVTIARSYGSTNESFTLQNAGLHLQFVLRLRQGSTFTHGTFRPMIRMADVDDGKFTPRDSVIASISTEPNGLPGIPVASGGNYTDTDGQEWICDTIDLEAGTWTKRCGVVTLDESRTYTLDHGAFYTPLNELIRSNDYRNVMLCDRLAVVDYNGTTATTSNTISGYRNASQYPGQNWIYLNVENISTAADLATWLGTHPIKVVYVLATPEETQLTEEQLTALRSIRSRKGLTYLYSTDQAQPEFSAEMYVDIPTYIQSLLSQMDRGFNVATVNNGLEFTSIE